MLGNLSDLQGQVVFVTSSARWVGHAIALAFMEYAGRNLAHLVHGRFFDGDPRSKKSSCWPVPAATVKVHNSRSVMVRTWYAGRIGTAHYEWREGILSLSRVKVPSQRLKFPLPQQHPR